MRIVLGADHAGFALKNELRDRLAAAGHDVADVGANAPESVDYPDFAIPVAEAVAKGEADRGILVCSTGVGMSMAANKVAGVRAALAMNADEVRLTRDHNDANVLALGARYQTLESAGELVDIFLNTPFGGGERHARRIAKLARLDNPENGDK